MIIGNNTIIRKFKEMRFMPLVAGFYVVLGSGMVYSGFLTLANLLK
jgi:hypothetical protein